MSKAAPWLPLWRPIISPLHQATFDLTQCTVGYHHVKDANGGTNSLRLRVTNASGETKVLDCEPLGGRQFETMFAQMEAFNKEAPERLVAETSAAQ